MGEKPLRRFGPPSWRDVGAAAVAGAIAGLGHPPFELWFLTVAAFGVAFMMLARSPNVTQAAWLGLGFGTGYFAVSLHWIVEPFFVDPIRHGWMAPFAIVLLSVGLALFWALAFGVARRLSPGGALLVTLPAAELVRAYIFTGFPWAMPSYVLVDQAVGGLAAWIGPHALNMVVLALAWVLGQVLLRRGQRQIIAMVASVAGFGAFSPGVADPGAAQAEAPIVRLVQPNAPQREKWDPAHMGRFFDRSVDFTAEGEVRPDLIVWPETSIPTVLHRADTLLEIVTHAAQGTPVIVGINRFRAERVYNSAALIDETGAVSQIYDKHHLVPFGEYIPLGDWLSTIGIQGFASRHGEAFSSGPGPALLDLGPLGQALPLICYEAVFPQDVLGTPERPDFILHMTNDAWFGNFSGPYQHLAQARMRAIETGLPVLRAANTGVSAAIDGRGRMIASLPLNEAGYVDAALPAPLAETLYSRIGDVAFTVLLLLMLAGMVARSVFKTD